MATEMGGIGALIGIGGGLAGLLGGGSTVNPEAGNANSAYQNASGDGNALGTAGQNSLGEYNSFAPTADNAVTNELNYLNTNPYTSTYDQAKLAQGMGGAMQGYTQAKAALANDLGARGLAGPGGASSALSGGDAGIDAAEAGSLATGQNNVAMDAIQARARNLAMANQVAAAHAGSLFSQGAQGASQGGELLDSTGNDWLNEGQQQINNTEYSNQQQAAGLGAITQLVGSGALGGL